MNIIVQPTPTSEDLSKFSDPSFPDPCRELKLIGELSDIEFRKLFLCLNQKGGLDALRPVLLDNPKNTETFVKLYNDLFGAHPNRRLDTLNFIESFKQNGGLRDFLKLSSISIESFIESPDFDQSLKPLLESILTDDAHLLNLLKDLLNTPETFQLSSLLQNTIDRGILEDLLNTTGNFLRQNSSQNLTSFLRSLFELQPSPNTLSWEDIYQLNYQNLPTYFLRTMHQLQMEDRLPVLIHLFSSLLNRRSATVLSQDRLEKLKIPDALTPEQRKASLTVLSNHPQNDLIALVKLVSAFNRGFMEDEDPSQNRNLLYSMDTFLQAVKTGFDAENSQGPDAASTRIITIYCLYLNLSYVELMNPEFHRLSMPEKISQYTSLDPESLISKNYQKYLLDYEHQKTREVLYKYREALENERDPENPDLPRYTPQEIRKMVRTREREFKATELPALLITYQDFLMTEIKSAIFFINERPLFLNFTLHDILLKLKDEKNIALSAQKVLLALDDDLLEQFAVAIIQGLLKDFYEFNRPVEDFMRSVDVEHSGATWLSHTVHPLIHGFGPGMPIKDQISIIAIIESFQAIEKLLITENKFQDIKSIFLPFLKTISTTGEEERILKLVQFLHSGEFRDGHHESKEPITQLSPLLISSISSGLFESSLNLLAFMDPDADIVNRVFNFLTLSSYKKDILRSLNLVFSPSDPWLLQEKIKYAIHTFDGGEDWEPLKNLLISLNAANKLDLMDISVKLATLNGDRPITPMIQTIQTLILNHEPSLQLFLTQVGFFLSQENNTLFMSLIQKYQKTKKSNQNFLTQMIKQDQMQPLLQILLDMLNDNSFRLTGHLMKDLIDRGELEKSLDLLVKLLLIQGGA